MSEPTVIGDIDERIDQVEEAVNLAMRALVESKAEHRQRGHSATWHVRGQIYHARRLCGRYAAIAGEVGGRAAALLPDNPPEVLIMRSLEMQELLYEFYAFLALARISLDELRHVLRPVVVPANGGSLPKSIKDLVRGVTDCPVLLELQREPLLYHLIDLRDCLVHHKSFASAEVIVVVQEGSDEDPLATVEHLWSRPVTRATYRLAEGGRIVVNVLLPDRIYAYPTDDDRGSLVSPFTYDDGLNLLTQIVEFLRFGAYQVIQSFRLLQENDGKTFSWERASRSKGRARGR
jgi:hypothetical protein